jgi:hypothetical protein
MEEENLVKGSALNNPGAVKAPRRNPATPKTPFPPKAENPDVRRGHGPPSTALLAKGLGLRIQCFCQNVTALFICLILKD